MSSGFLTLKWKFDTISSENTFPMSNIRYMSLEYIWQMSKIKDSKSK